MTTASDGTSDHEMLETIKVWKWQRRRSALGSSGQRAICDL